MKEISHLRAFSLCILQSSRYISIPLYTILLPTMSVLFDIIAHHPYRLICLARHIHCLILDGPGFGHFDHTGPLALALHEKRTLLPRWILPKPSAPSQCLQTAHCPVARRKPRANRAQTARAVPGTSTTSRTLTMVPASSCATSGEFKEMSSRTQAFSSEHQKNASANEPRAEQWPRGDAAVEIGLGCST